MGKQFNDSEVFINEEVEFSIGAEDWDYPGDSETTINILGTIRLVRYEDESGRSRDWDMTRDIESALIEAIIDKL
jgi:hypothetical protein